MIARHVKARLQRSPWDEVSMMLRTNVTVTAGQTA
jgi:hypothetical protein